MAPPPSRSKAAHEPKASPGLISTPASVTCKSFLGMLNLITSLGCICPGRPIASSTCFQSLTASFGADELPPWPAVTGLLSRNISPTVTHASVFRARRGKLRFKEILAMTHASFLLFSWLGPERIQVDGLQRVKGF